MELDDLEYQLVEAKEASRAIVRKREDRRRQLLAEARVRIEAQINEEFPELTEALRIEAERQQAFDHAKLEAAKTTLNRLSNYGVLAEWKRHERNRYNPEKREWLYPTGRRAVIEMYTQETQLPENYPAWKRIWKVVEPGTMFLRRIKKNGEKSLQIITVLRNGELPSNWYPEGEIPKRAAALDR